MAKFEACSMKCVGGVRSNARCGNGQKWRQNACSTQNGRLPVEEYQDFSKKDKMLTYAAYNEDTPEQCMWRREPS